MQGFDEIVEQYTPMIHHSINRLRIFKNKDEFFQIGLIALWDAYKRFDHEKGEFSSYAYSFIRGRMLTELNKHIKREEHNVSKDETYWDVIQGDADVEIDLRILLNDLPELNERQRQWALYTVEEGLSIREIAKRERVSESAVKKWRKAAREILKRTLQEGL